MTGAATLTARLTDVLRCFALGHGAITIDARTLDGIGHLAGEQIRGPIKHTPLHILKLLSDGFSLRIAPYTKGTDGRPVDLPMLFACWHLARTFDSDGRPVIESAAARPVRQALATMPRPSVLVDARHEVWAGWQLSKPLSPSAAPGLLSKLAARLGAVEMTWSELEGCHLPLVGTIRNWSTVHIEDIEILEADPLRQFSIDEVINSAKGQTTHA